MPTDPFTGKARQPVGGADRLDALAIGQQEEIVRTVTAEDVAAFARLSGDFNALHLDEQFAARTSFRRPVAHGFLQASLLSTLVGMKLPGEGALYLSQSIEFTRPVFVGDTVTARGIIDTIDRDTRTVTLRTEIVNQHQQVVLDGVAKVHVLRVANAQPATGDRMPMPASDGLLQGKRALITGSSRGIGRAIALLLAANGARVVVNYLNSELAAESLVAEIEEQGGQATLFRADVTDAAGITQRVAEVAGDSLDILVNNAGPRITSGTLATLSWPDMQRAFGDIVGAAFNTTQAALPALRNSQGRVVNVLTAGALGRTAHGWLPYVTAKAALLAMSKNLAQELGPAGIRVNMVSPSLAETDLTSDIPDKIKQMMIARTPLRRLATAEDIAGAVLFLVSPYADFVTGDNLLVTGGEVML